MSDLNQEEEEDDLALNENEIVRVIDLDDGEKGKLSLGHFFFL